jgi:hypothetical protein
MRFEGEKSSRVQKFKSSRVQEYKSTRVQEYKSTKVQEYKRIRKSIGYIIESCLNQDSQELMDFQDLGKDGHLLSLVVINGHLLFSTERIY